MIIMGWTGTFPPISPPNEHIPGVLGEAGLLGTDDDLTEWRGVVSASNLTEL